MIEPKALEKKIWGVVADYVQMDDRMGQMVSVIAREALATIFASDGNEEARWIEDGKLACHHCGGSGHKDDVRATPAESALESARKVIEELVYETTHLSPEEDDGSHLCKISKAALTQARQWLSANPEVKG